MIANTKKSFAWLRTAKACLALTIATVGIATLNASPIIDYKDQSEIDSTLRIHIDDVAGSFEFNNHFTREIILREAFYNAARRADWVGEYEFNYNRRTPGKSEQYLEFRVLNWERSRTGVFTFTASAQFHIGNGEVHQLGTVRGTRLSIDVFNGFDLRDHFEESAEDGFRLGLKKLHKKIS